VVAYKSRTKSPRNSKISQQAKHMLRNNNAHQFQEKRSKVKVTRPITAKTESVSYLPNEKADELQNWYADQRPMDHIMRYQLSRPSIKACVIGFLHAGGGIPCRPLRAAATQLVNLGLHDEHQQGEGS